MNNTAILTAGNAVYSRKRAKKRARVEELTFDPQQRNEYLTGFRKRKTQRQQKAAEFLKDKERKERIEARKEMREARKADIVQRLKAVNAKLEGGNEGEQTELEEMEIQVPKDPIWENHFEDAEKMTTVTVIEDFHQVGLETVDAPPKPSPANTVQAPPSKTKRHPESKKKAFRYGTKAERQSTRKKTKLKSHSKPHHKRK